MKEIIVRACAIIAVWIALCAPWAFASPIGSGTAARADISGNLMSTPAPDTGYVETAWYALHSGIGDMGTGSNASGGISLESVASGLFGKVTDQGMAESFYVDPTTLCVTVAGMKTQGISGLLLDERICQDEKCHGPMPVPGTMFIMGLGLLGLSYFKKRDPRIVLASQKAVISEPTGFIPADLYAAEAFATKGSSSVVTMRAAQNGRTILRETEKYRTVIQMKRRPQDLRKEMAG